MARHLPSSLFLAAAFVSACGDRPEPTRIDTPMAAIALPDRHGPVDTSRFVTRFRERGGGGVFVKLTAEPVAEAMAALRAAGLQPPAGRGEIVTFDSLRIAAVWGYVDARAVKALAALPYVKRIGSSEDEHGIFPHSNPPVNPDASEVPWNLDRVRAPDLWRDFDATGQRQTGPTGWQSASVAVLDDGGDYRLSYPQTSNGCNNWEFFSAIASTPPNFTADTTPTFLGQHGTWVGGFAGAEPNNVCVAGVAPRAAISFYKVLPAPDWGSIVAGLNQAYIYGPAVINMSFGNCGQLPPPEVQEAIQQFSNRVPSDAAYPGVGVSLVAAAGNGTSSTLDCPTRAVVYPAAYPEVIAVAAIDVNNDTDPTFSVGPQVELSAPGICVDGLRVGGGVDPCISGTSFAAPHVSATIAAIRAIRNTWSASYVRTRLQQTAIKITGQTLPRDDRFGYGIVNGYTVLSPPLSVTILGPNKVRPNTYCTWWASVSGGTGSYTYQWSGVLLGSGPEISGIVSGSGLLYLDVTDSGGAMGGNNLYVTVTPSAPMCLL